MQIQSDTIMKRVVRPVITETTALGAAYMAGLAVGYWESIESLQKQWQVERAFEPVAAREAMEEKIRNWKRAVERSKNWYTSR
jgi:glycerol kinase